ncbi:hypothetical protein R7Q39_26030 [Vibrio sp. 947]|uniref:hypothetical protein n=1 Tax=Vibrio sp. 947 TaxID=3074619 RepID=UPI000B0ED651|nr:hypothetical protein [Vibrio sp. 947]MDW1928843.1 hypothetical protein [Vibrio sp. 947]
MRKLKQLFYVAVAIITLYVGYKLTQYLFALLVVAAIGLFLYLKFKPKKQPV